MNSHKTGQSESTGAFDGHSRVKGEDVFEQTHDLASCLHCHLAFYRVPFDSKLFYPPTDRSNFLTVSVAEKGLRVLLTSIFL